MSETAYVAIGDDGYVSLFWGDGTESERYVIIRGPRATQGQALIDAIEDLTAWAHGQGYRVIVPRNDLAIPDIAIDVPEDEIEQIDMDDVDDLLDDLYYAGGYDTFDPDSDLDVR